MDMPEVLLTVGPEGEQDYRLRLEVFFRGHEYSADHVVSAQQVLSAVDLGSLTKQVVGTLFSNMGAALQAVE